MKWVISSREYKGEFEEGEWSIREGENWIDITRKDGKIKISIPREAINYIMQIEQETKPQAKT